MSASHLTLIEDEGPQPYPFAKAFRMPTHYFVPWWFNRWLNSTFHLTASYEVQGVAVALFSLAQNQAPIGTLPAEDEILARLLRLDVRKWKELCRCDVGPLYGWHHVDCEGEIRLGHPVVIEVLRDCADRATAKTLSKEERAVAKRQERLKAALRDLGVKPDILGDALSIAAMDEWLSENWKRRRDAMAYQKVLNWAAQEVFPHRRRAMQGQ
jgi:hypothetical protein